ncbi:peripheral-type benzodiazepine receptor-associated protein 1 [Eublepharis macularius]|uniref:Peripheral-type benzodiazepine receptor-associated protein 1 n=1 Tax=Eublepharis macularius TaxID=481883 RepID=A0AA97LJK3_EUBMA|nr:peripheral-type benzodiazepine receptor-associated protein 1 [Eublepharis macularius]
MKYGVSYRCLLRQNQVLLTALEELQSQCASLKKENSLLRKTCFPETQEKVKHLKRKNAELAVIAKRLEERARKLQEANLRVVNAPVSMKGSCAGLCKKALARQRATDLREQASVLLAKDKQICALEQECRELQAKIRTGKEGPPCLPLPDFHHLLRESQKEVLRLQRQIALKNFKASLSSGCRGAGDISSAARMGPPVTTKPSCPKETLPHKKVIAASSEIKQQIQQLESELRKKRKQCENLEHEVRKKHKRYAELEIQLQEVRSDNARLSEENALLHGQVEWTEKIESENADLRLQVTVVTEERDSALQKSQDLQNRLESLGQALQHMRDVAERRQQLELEHEKALQNLQKKQDEVRQLQQAQAEARKEHEGAVQLLESSLDCMQDRVRELEDQCRSHTEQFNFLSQELRRFQLQTGKSGLRSSSPTVASEVPLCPASPQLLDGRRDRGLEIVPVAPQCSRKSHNERAGEFGALAPQLTDPVAPTASRSPDSSTPTIASKKLVKKLETQSSSSRSESMHHSSKSCATPEVDTASEMEELDIDSISMIPELEHQSPVKLHVFLVRYSYNPFDGPNESPEAELPLTAGEYIYIYGEMDEDGFFEGELMDGRRGLVPSNFVERISDDDLVTFLPQELNDVSQSSPLERSFLSTSISSGERSDYSFEELSTSTAPSRLEGDQEELGDPMAVPYPRKVTLIKQFGSSILVGWEPPLLPAGYSDVQGYNIYVDAELRQNMKAGSQTKAVLEKLDLKTKAYRISVQSVLEKGSSDRLRCTFLVGRDFALAPTQLQIRNLSATSAEISWLPSNSNFLHVVSLNGEERDTTKAGIYWYTFRNLNPSTSYVATVEVQPPQAHWETSQERREQPLLSEIHFITTSAGSPDAPLDVRAEPGPSAGILAISWLPVTIDAEGSSNGVRVTGYAVYADGQKVMEVTSPTAGSVLVDVSQMQILQVCREVSVRTVSLYGESADSVPAQIPSALLGDVGQSSPSQPSHPTSQLPCGEMGGSLTPQASQEYSAVPSPGADNSLAKFSSRPNADSEGSVNSPLAEASPSRCSVPTGAPLTHVPQAPAIESETPPGEERNSLVPSANRLTAEKLANPGKETEGDNKRYLLAAEEPKPERSGSGDGNLEGCKTCSVEQEPKEPLTERGSENTQSCPGSKIPAPGEHSTHREDSSGDSGQSNKQSSEFFTGTLGRKLLKEISRDDSTLTGSRGEKRLDPGNRPLNLLTDHSRGSDLSDIMEEEEEEEEEEELDSGDTDSDEEILEQILEMPLQKKCSKALFSIPEVTEEEEEEDWEHVPRKNFSPPPEKAEDRVPEGPLPYNTRRTNPLPPVSSQQVCLPKRNQTAPEQILLERDLPQKLRGEDDVNEEPVRPEISGRWNWESQEKRLRSPGTGRTSQWKRPGRCKEKAHSQPQANRMRKVDVREHGRSSHQSGGGGLYRTQSLKENLDVITSLGLEEASDLYSWARPRTFQTSPRRRVAHEVGEEAVRGLPLCVSPESLEIDIEYDSEDDQDLTMTSTPVSQLSSDGRADGSPTDCEDGWSDCSSQSGSIRSSAQRELKRSSSWEDESMEWIGSPSRSPGHRCWEKRALVGSEERSRSLERNPSLWRAVPERPWKGGSCMSMQTRVRELLPSPAGVVVTAGRSSDCASSPAPGLPAFGLVAGNGDLESPNSMSWQASTRRGRRPQRKRHEVAPHTACSGGSWKSPLSETMNDGNSARLFVALFDYDPVSMSPNPDAAEEELPFQEGQILKVYGHKDADGFYRGECAGRTGYIPCNMVSEVQVDSDAARKQLLQDGHIPANMLVESLGALAQSGKQHETKTMVAIFDYNPKESSPNMDMEAELKFCTGDIVMVVGSMDDDGFYFGEVNGQKGLVPSNFLEAMPSDGVLPGEPRLGRQSGKVRAVDYAEMQPPDSRAATVEDAAMAAFPASPLPLKYKNT